MSKNESYEDFVNKFKSKRTQKTKKTTDDCYTPENVYNVIADWVAKEYNVHKNSFVRPFYPGGNYQGVDYTGKIVVDNPPFSILSQIVDFYVENNVRFFLFAPTLTMFSAVSSRNCAAIIIGEGVTYENGARVNTSFVTNLEPENIRIRTTPELYQAVKNANKKRLQLQRKLPTYEYPPYLVTSSRLQRMAKNGIEIKITRNESEFVRYLDSQKPKKKAIYGAGYLISENAKNRVEAAKNRIEAAKNRIEAAKCEAADLETKEYWQLSDRESEIINKLSRSYSENIEEVYYD